ncbi:MAG TPA: winged helix-turn-helix domain-containing protein [Candidatus Solibacter sp.]|nr:winged helix-turn-helix domain-containing protein [Candidatus Solibacter sp.]
MTLNVIPTMDSGMDGRSTLAPPVGSRFIRFGPFQVDHQRQEVTRNGSRLKLQGKVYQVLVALLEKQGEVVTREELRQRLWPADTHVNYDANVNTTVNKLRQVLGDSTDKPLYIETIPRKGYCLLAPAEGSEVPAPMLAQDAAVEPVSAIPFIGLATSASEPTPQRSGFWIPIGVVGLVLAGMLLGAGITITTLLLSRFAQTTRWP